MSIEIQILYVLSFILYIGIVVLSFILGIYFYLKAKRSRKKLGNWNYYTISVSLFFLIEGASHIFRWYFMHLYPADLNAFLELITASDRIDPMLILLTRIHVVLIFFGTGMLAFGVENKIYKKSKYLFTAIIVISTIFILFVPYEAAVLIQNIPILACVVIIGFLILLYFHYARKSEGETRKRFLLTGLGFANFFLGAIFNSQGFRVILHIYQNPFIITMVSPTLLLMGLVIFYLGFRKPEE